MAIGDDIVTGENVTGVNVAGENVKIVAHKANSYKMNFLSMIVWYHHRDFTIEYISGYVWLFKQAID